VIGRSRRILLAVPLACAGALLASAGANAAVTPAGVPTLTSAAFASPVTLHWTPGTTDQSDHGDHGNGHGHHHGGIAQLVVRAPGACPMAFGTARVVASYQDGAEHDFSDAVADGTYCYSVITADGESFAGSPPLTVVVDAAAVQPVPAPAPAPAVPVVAPAPPPADMVAPTAPAGMKLIISRARAGSARVPVTVRWSLPADADHVEVVLNARHAPTTRIDGTVVYRGNGTSTQVTVAPGRKTFVALFAVDAAGNTSRPTLQTLLAPVASSLRPLDGSRLTGSPVLSWKPVAGASYYNVQLFRNGKRVHVAWPGQPSYRLPATVLRAGTYVWFVWPALAPKHASPKFAARIGRGTFTYVG